MKSVVSPQYCSSWAEDHCCILPAKVNVVVVQGDRLYASGERGLCDWVICERTKQVDRFGQVEEGGDWCDEGGLLVALLGERGE